MKACNIVKPVLTQLYSCSRDKTPMSEQCCTADYQLLVYGNKRQDERYCAKCERLISKLGMEDHVALKGVAKPSEILRQGWMYLQVGATCLCPLACTNAYLN